MGLLNNHIIPTKEHLMSLGFTELFADNFDDFPYMFTNSWGLIKNKPTNQYGTINLLYIKENKHYSLEYDGDAPVIKISYQFPYFDKYEFRQVYDIADVISILYEMDTKYGTLFTHCITK